MLLYISIVRSILLLSSILLNGYCLILKSIHVLTWGRRASRCQAGMIPARPVQGCGEATVFHGNWFE